MVFFEVICEDIVSVQGKNLDLLSRQSVQGLVINKMIVFFNVVFFLLIWKFIIFFKYQLLEIEEEEKKSMKRVYYFCIVNDDYQLFNEYKNLGRKYYILSKFDLG